MREQINIVIGVVGTATSWTLGQWEHVAGIAAGAATVIYMAASCFFLLRKNLKQQNNEA